MGTTPFNPNREEKMTAPTRRAFLRSSAAGLGAGAVVLAAVGGCSGAGPGSCTQVPEERCGDNALAASEFCDDGDTDPGDGCSATCTVEPGWDCTPGNQSVCTQVGRCGDGS